jgi:hypothetical protein
LNWIVLAPLDSDAAATTFSIATSSVPEPALFSVMAISAVGLLFLDQEVASSNLVTPIAATAAIEQERCREESDGKSSIGTLNCVAGRTLLRSTFYSLLSGDLACRLA